jgi:hypothetical protein
MASYISMWLGITDDVENPNNLYSNYSQENNELYFGKVNYEEDFREAVFFEDMV